MLSFSETNSYNEKVPAACRSSQLIFLFETPKPAGRQAGWRGEGAAPAFPGHIEHTCLQSTGTVSLKLPVCGVWPVWRASGVWRVKQHRAAMGHAEEGQESIWTSFGETRTVREEKSASFWVPRGFHRPQT